MKQFLATDALDDVRWATARGLADGVVLPDAALGGGATPEDARTWLGDYCRDVDVPVFVAFDDVALEEPFAAARELGRVAYPFTDQSLVDGAQRPSAGERLRVTPP